MRFERTGTHHSLRLTPRGAGDTSDAGQIPTALWRLFACIWLLFLFYPVTDVLHTRPGTASLLLTLLGATLLIALYLWLALPPPQRMRAQVFSPATLRRHLALLAVLTAAVCCLTMLSSGDWLWFAIFVSIAAGARLPARPALITLGVLAALVVGIGWQALGWVYAFRVALPVLAVGCGVIGLGWLIATVSELRAAREELARLAVAEERLRFARDLHDLLGQSLSTITLKNELARALVPTQPERAIAEMAEAIGVARTALREVREAVTGYRQPTLATELANARVLLEAAGITCQIERDADSARATGALTTAGESVLAWAVREGVTNVVRYSRARTCCIALHGTADRAILTITDDGQPDDGIAARPASDETTGPAAARQGTGLRGLAERAAEVQGHVEASPVPTGGFCLRVSVPVQSAPAGAALRSQQRRM